MRPEASVKKVETLASLSLGPLYLGYGALQLFILQINANLGMARRPTGCNVPDQHIYTVKKQDGSVVLMESEGMYGRFNRAQRALQNTNEVLPSYLANFFSVGYVFPWLTSGITVLWGMLRMKGAFDYTDERNSRQGGNLPAMLLMGILQGLGLAIGARALMLELKK